jgi:hypothetical protein
MRGHNTSGGYYQSYVRRLGTFDALHNKACRIGPGQCVLPRVILPRTSVNRARRRAWAICLGLLLYGSQIYSRRGITRYVKGRNVRQCFVKSFE